jgi:hypothetical protein
MQVPDPAAIHAAIADGWVMRTGRKVGRTLYLHDPAERDRDRDLLVGLMDTPELAEAVADAWNEYWTHP